MVNWIKNRLLALLRWARGRAPEVLGILFLACLLPLAYFLALTAAGLVRWVVSDRHSFWQAQKANPWPALAWVVCVVGLMVLARLLWPSRFLIWAVARKMIIEALHRKTVLILLIFFVVLMPSLPFILETEGNPKSQVQIVISYALALAEVLLSLLAIFVCTASICSEIEKKQVQVTDTKPLRRWQFLVGKLFGVMVMCAAVLFLMAGAVYGLVGYMTRERDVSYLTLVERERQQEWQRRVREEVLVTRRSVRLPVPDVSREVEQVIQELHQQDKLASKAHEIARRRSLTSVMRKYRMSVQPRRERPWMLKGLRPGPDLPLYLRFKLSRTNFKAPKHVLGLWVNYERVQPPDEQSGSGSDGALRVRLANPPIEGRWMSGAFQEIELPNWVVDPSGTLYFSYINMQTNPPSAVIFDPEEGIEVLQRTEGFFPNYYRSLLLILFHITLLAALALMAGSALSFPVASLTVAAIFMVGLIAPWVEGATGAISTPEAAATLGEFINGWSHWLFQVFLKSILTLAPHFSRYSPVGNLVVGRAVTWGYVGQAAAVLCFLQATGAMILGIYFYGRRELARVIV